MRAAAAIGLLFVFLVGVNGLGDGFNALGRGLLDSFFAATSNPFLGLTIGILATTLVQSSSVSTSLIVGLVAAPENPLPLANAVPMIMGANIGTTVTNTIVSLFHIGPKAEFRSAFSVATCHDFFNFMAVAILLPLELATGLLGRTAAAIVSALPGFGGVQYESPIKGVIKTALAWMKIPVDSLFSTAEARAAAMILFSVALIFAALVLLVRVLRATLKARVSGMVAHSLETSPLLAIGIGIAATVMVQSSSITTALLVPLAGAGIVTLQQAFPITIGANIGTTVTALLAALSISGANADAGVTIAIVHLLFNLTAALIIYPAVQIRALPLNASQRLADVAVRSRAWAVAYVALLFYGLPMAITALARLSN